MKFFKNYNLFVSSLNEQETTKYEDDEGYTIYKTKGDPWEYTIDDNGLWWGRKRKRGEDPEDIDWIDFRDYYDNKEKYAAKINQLDDKFTDARTKEQKETDTDYIQGRVRQEEKPKEEEEEVKKPTPPQDKSEPPQEKSEPTEDKEERQEQDGSEESDIEVGKTDDGSETTVIKDKFDDDEQAPTEKDQVDQSLKSEETKQSLIGKIFMGIKSEMVLWYEKKSKDDHMKNHSKYWKSIEQTGSTEGSKNYASLGRWFFISTVKVDDKGVRTDIDTKGYSLITLGDLEIIFKDCWLVKKPNQSLSLLFNNIQLFDQDFKNKFKTFKDYTLGEIDFVNDWAQQKGFVPKGQNLFDYYKSLPEGKSIQDQAAEQKNTIVKPDFKRIQQTLRTQSNQGSKLRSSATPYPRMVYDDTGKASIRYFSEPASTTK
jgi:hypothetical protein